MGACGSRIPFNRPSATGRELDAITEAVERAHLAADGTFTARCTELLEAILGHGTVLMVHSCTAALELSALLLDLQPGDEVIMPSYTFVTTAAAVALRGATPVFVDIREDTLNIDETLVADAITERTRAIVAVHYAGVGCELLTLRGLAETAGVELVEDAAQGLCARYRGRALGTFGSLAAISFHETKNVTSGHGGALIVNDPDLQERAQVMRDKGTNRHRFSLGLVDKYTWVDLGSSYAMSELSAAFLWPQLQDADPITAKRMRAWEIYHERFAEAEAAGVLRRPVIPEGCEHNAHMYYLLLPSAAMRDELMASLRSTGVDAVFHYVPLHSSPAGLRYGRADRDLPVTDDLSARVLRLPLWTGIDGASVERIAATVLETVGGGGGAAKRSFTLNAGSG